MNAMQAVILSIGDELVLGQTVDTNSAYLAAQMTALGIFPRYHHTVADDRAAIAAALRQAAAAAPWVLVTGGLGPTKDDLTREALADALGVELEMDEASLAQVAQFFAARGRVMTESNRVQAQRPRGARHLTNRHGTAPGLCAKLGSATVLVMPGVPREMKGMFAEEVWPILEAALPPGARPVILTDKVNTFGTGESVVGELLGDLMQRDRNPTVGTTVAQGVVSVRVRSVFPDEAQARAEMESTITAVAKALGPIVYGRGETSLAQVIVALLRERHLTLATAESCTGGMLGQLLTDVPGSSLMYRGGWVTYSNEMKMSQLGVPQALLTQHGAVSGPVAAAMAQGALQRSGADAALSLTGVAGPDGGTAEKPVGTVWLGIALRPGLAAGAGAYHLLIPGDRAGVRDRACKTALQALRLCLLGQPLTTLAWIKAAASSRT